MSISLPELVDIDHTRLDFQGIINLTTQIVRNHPEYFSDVDDFTQGNAGRMTIELISFIVELLADRIDHVANELLLPTATQKGQVMDLLKLINYRLRMLTTASANVRATISKWINPFVIPARFSVPGRDRDGEQIRFEMLMKNDEDKYIYEGPGSNYEFDTGFESSPILVQNDLPFYQGRSHQEFFNMTGMDNESVRLNMANIEEGSIRVWKITRNNDGQIISKRELPNVSSYISPEAQRASDSNLPPFKIEPTENSSAHLVFGERQVVSIFDSSGNEEIMVWYRTTVGEKGNIPRGFINYNTTLVISGKSIRLSLVNNIAGSGGGESETIEHAKKYGPLSITTVNKTVNPEDFIIILQNYSALLNAIAYGKSNEPNVIKEEYGHYIPPYETWIYPIFNKDGWESMPTYSYQKSMQLSRPYIKYGLADKEIVEIPVEGRANLEKFDNYSDGESYNNIVVSNFFNSTRYVPGADYVIDTNARELIRLEGGSIENGQKVIVQYYENNKINDDVRVNFATGDTQPMPRAPIYPGLKTNAWSLNLQNQFKENNLSFNDYNYPSNDYIIDFDSNEITKNGTFPIICSYTTLGIENEFITGINNEFILNLDGLNRVTYNNDHDIKIAAKSGWARIGSGASVDFVPGQDYYFTISIDGKPSEEYKVYLDGAYTTRELANTIWEDAVDYDTETKQFKDLPVEIFADKWESEASPPLTIMSNTEGGDSSIGLGEGRDSERTLFRSDLKNIMYGSGEEFGVIELSRRLRFAFNSKSLCTGFRGQDLEAGEEEKPEIYAINNLEDVENFTLSSTNNTIKFEITGTNLGDYDGEHKVVFDSVTGGDYNLTRTQDVFDLISDMQHDIDNVIAQDVIKVFWVRNKYGNYRIGFKLHDTFGNSSNKITIKDGDTHSARVTLRFSEEQSSVDGNLLEAKVLPSSDMIEDFKICINLLGAFGENAFIKTKATNALHNNTLESLKFGNNQSSRGSGIHVRTLLSENDLIGTSLIYSFTADVDNTFSLDITGAPSGIEDDNYQIIIPEGEYNIGELVEQINTSFEDVDGVDLSSFLVCEKQEGLQRIRIIMTDYDEDVTPDVRINNENDEEIELTCIDKLGFVLNRSMSDFSTIILHYAGDWVSNPDNDNSDERKIKRHLSDKRLISQDYIIKDSVFTPFDIKGIVYCSKGFDREVIKEEVKENIHSNFKLDKREFADSAAISNITRNIESVEGTIYTTIEYFGKDYQLYRKFKNKKKSATVEGYKPAENVVARWSDKSAFKITVDGTATGGVNYDGSYLIIVGNSWDDRDYDSLRDAILNGDGSTGGLSHAVPLSMGKTETNLGIVLEVSHSSGIFKIATKNEGPATMIKIEDPDDIYTNGYQNFSRSSNVEESEYVKDETYRILLSINGSSDDVYNITSPSSGEWTLKQIASQLNNIIPVNSNCGIDDNGKIRITSTTGGNQSTIDIEVALGVPGRNLIALLGGTEDPVDGSHGHISCLNDDVDGTLYIDAPVTAYGLEDEPTKDKLEKAFNYKDKIPAKYNETLIISDDLYSGATEELENQEHGIILEYVELGRENG